MKSMKKAVLFVSHRVNEDTMEKYQKLRNELPGCCDVYWALDKTKEKNELPDGVLSFKFSLADICALGYELLYDNCISGSINFALQWFYRLHPEYDCYWSIEYDVVFTGNWRVLIEAFEDSGADFVSCHIERYDKGRNAHWDWWNPVVWVDEDIPLERRVKAFNPIYCLSNRAISFLDGFFRKGNSGHYETLMSTALHVHGFKLVDMGGTGEFTPPEFKNRFYVQGFGVNNGTMRFRPVFLKEEVKALGVTDRLFHPLK